MPDTVIVVSGTSDPAAMQGPSPTIADAITASETLAAQTEANAQAAADNAAAAEASAKAAASAQVAVRVMMDAVQENVNIAAAEVVGPLNAKVALVTSIGQQVAGSLGASESAASSASASANTASEDAGATHDDRLLADADVVLTHADVVLTHADADQTALDRIACDADIASIAGGPVASVDGQTGIVGSILAPYFLHKSNDLSDVTASAARTNLGLGGAALLAATAFFQVANLFSELSDGDLVTAKTNLGLGSAANVNSDTLLLISNALSELASVAATARANLGLGTISTHATGDFCLASNNLSEVTPGTALGNLGGLAKSLNLSDLASASSSRSNLGLGTAAVKASSSTDTTLASLASGSYTANHLAVFNDSSGTLKDGGAVPTGAWVQIGSTLTGARASAIFTSIPLTYTQLKVVMSNVTPSSVSAQVNAEFSTNNGTDSYPAQIALGAAVIGKATAFDSILILDGYATALASLTDISSEYAGVGSIEPTVSGYLEYAPACYLLRLASGTNAIKIIPTVGTFSSGSFSLYGR